MRLRAFMKCLRRRPVEQFPLVKNLQKPLFRILTLSPNLCIISSSSRTLGVSPSTFASLTSSPRAEQRTEAPISFGGSEAASVLILLNHIRRLPPSCFCAFRWIRMESRRRSSRAWPSCVLVSNNVQCSKSPLIPRPVKNRILVACLQYGTCSCSVEHLN